MPLSEDSAELVLKTLGLQNCGMMSNVEKSVGILESYRFITQTSKKENLFSKIDVPGNIVPICSFCHRIRTEDGKWHTLEVFWNDITHAKLSHGICPLCCNIFYDFQE